MEKKRLSPDTPTPLSKTDIRDRACLRCSRSYVGGSQCPYCNGFGKSDNDQEMLRKTFDPPDLKKGSY